ncbi:hypothetical protein PVAP13_3NG247263 [Panicum virgatum]|uniref:Uncharacterized protein n=1 Tax=Panicum virgatum TaxID=38727 RepID=A0A8T0UFA1_PANVG|nr:hypothetical protein PVAP13_3NG247263 [Panicum virgatum]
MFSSSAGKDASNPFIRQRPLVARDPSESSVPPPPWASDCIYPIVPECLKQSTALEFSCTLDLIFLLCWTIWTCRNDVIFQHQLVSLLSCRVKFKIELTAFAPCEAKQ